MNTPYVIINPEGMSGGGGKEKKIKKNRNKNNIMNKSSYIWRKFFCF